MGLHQIYSVAKIRNPFADFSRQMWYFLTMVQDFDPVRRTRLNITISSWRYK